MLVELAAVALLGGAGWALARVARRRLAIAAEGVIVDDLSRAAYGECARLGFEVERADAASVVAKGQVDGRAVRVVFRLERPSRSARWVAVAATADLSGPPWLGSADWRMSRRDAGERAREGGTGVVRGPSWLLCALRTDARALLQTLATHGAVEISRLRLVWETRVASSERTPLELVVRPFADLAGALERLAETPQAALREIVNDDPAPSTRVAALESLAAVFADTGEAREAFARALADRFPSVALAAASCAPPQLAVPRLLEMFASEGHDPESRARMLALLARHPAEPGVRAAIATAAGEPSPVCLLAVLALVDLRGPDVDAALVRAARSGDLTTWPGEVCERLVDAIELRSLPAADVEPALVALLAHPQDNARCAAARALTHTGSATALPALDALLFANPSRALRRLADTARRAIRDRLPQQGSLSLAHPSATEGALSVTDSGGLSVAHEDEG